MIILSIQLQYCYDNYNRLLVGWAGPLSCLLVRERGGGGVYPFHALSRDHIIVAGAGAGSI